MATIHIIHGPNLNLLGLREPQIYGQQTLQALNDALQHQAISLGHECVFIQSNSEGELIKAIQEAPEQNCELLLMNPAAYTHTSIALRDALLAVKLPFIEIHMTNLWSRESYRHQSYFSDIALGVIAGFGSYTYHLALLAAHEHLKLFAARGICGHTQN